MTLAGSLKSIPEHGVPWSQNRPFTRRMLKKQDQHGLRRENLSTGWSTTPTSLLPQSDTSRSAMTGYPGCSCVAWSMDFSAQLESSSCSLSSIVSHLWEGSQFQWYRWLTSWTGAMSGDTRTGGDVQKKSLLHMRYSLEQEAPIQWNERANQEKTYLKFSIKHDGVLGFWGLGFRV